MSHLNVEIKARCRRPERVRETLESHKADFRGLDHQIDTYFKVPKGRLKLREGNIEYSLIHYDRPNQAGPKDAHVTLFHPQRGTNIKDVLLASLDVLVVVDKRREIYFIGNVKFHIDTVAGLGSFVEIEAVDITGQLGREKLLEQCRHYMQLLGIAETDLVEGSYSDLLAGM